MPEIIRFSTNVPAEVALRYGDGKRLQGRHGEQVIYALVDDRFMYVLLCVADRIGELEIHPGKRTAAMSEMPRPHLHPLFTANLAAIPQSRPLPRFRSRFDYDLYAPDEQAARQEWDEQTRDLARDTEGRPLCR